MPSLLEEIVKHKGRLDVLRCLVDMGPLEAAQVAARIDEQPAAIRYRLRVLEAFNLVAGLSDPAGRPPLYAETLDHHAEWVRRAVRQHRRS